MHREPPALPRAFARTRLALVLVAGTLALAGPARADFGPTIKRSFAPVRTRIHAWDGDRPERAWQLESTLGLGAQAQVGEGPTGYRESVTTTSFLFSGIFELPRLQSTVRLQVPLILGSITPILAPGIADTRSILAFGNIAVEGSRLWRVASDLGIRLSGTIACPTIIEKDALAFGGLKGDVSTLARAAMAARGYDAPELWEPGQWSLSPTLSVLWRTPAVRIEPFAKAVVFIDPSNHTERHLHIDAVMGVRSTVRLSRRFDLGTRLWGRLPVFDSAALPALAAGAELRAHLPEVDLTLGGFVPIAVPGEVRVYGVSLAAQVAL